MGLANMPHAFWLVRPILSGYPECSDRKLVQTDCVQLIFGNVYVLNINITMKFHPGSKRIKGADICLHHEGKCCVL